MKELDRLLSLTLDGLVTAQRDRASIGVATDAELAALAASIPDPGRERDIIDNWRFVALRLDGDFVLRLLGDCRRDTPPWITSVVTAIDLGSGLARTSSGSLYRLGTRGEGEPPHGHVLHVAVALWQQAAPAARALGIPHVFH